MTISDLPLTDDFSPDPFWWGERRDKAPDDPSPGPAAADTAIIGAGITGLSAAITLARHGAGVVVYEAHEPGIGGSSRSAGVIGRSLKRGFSQILAENGAETACALYGEAREAFDFILDFIDENRIECGLRPSGRFIAANTSRHYESIARDLENKRRYLADDFEMVPRAAQRREIGTDLYFGGAVVPDHKTLDPFRLVQGLASVAREAGVVILANTSVRSVQRRDADYLVTSSKGTCAARNLVVATNGYTGLELGWFRRRLIPLKAYMIATEDLAPDMIREVLPTLRTFNDYRIDTEYARPCPDGRRLIFGGLTGRNYTDHRRLAAALRQKMIRLFPQLSGARIARAWTGRCAATFDLYPHIGEHGGMHYAMGYSFGSGLPLGLLFGHKIALRIFGRKGGESAFDKEKFEGRIFYTGNAWFMPLVMEYYRWREQAGF